MQVIIALSSVKPHLRGRAMGAIALGIGSSPLGMLLVGYLAELFGAPSALAMLTSTGVIIMSCLWAFLPDLRTNSI
jgi:predicted MFS family arabinose efflux permease